MSGADERDLEGLEIELMLEALARHYGYDFRQYARPSMLRRIHQAVEKEEVRTISALQEKVLHNPAAADRVVSLLTVHTTSMFRDPDFYLAFRRQVVPLLRTYPFVRIWHAGCSTGEEVYSLAILLEEEGLLERCRIYATDVSSRHLDRARLGIYPLKPMRDNTARYQKAGGKQDFSTYYTADHEYAVFRRNLSQSVLFSQHDLVSDGSFNDFHVILCRNVLIYFGHALRDRVVGLFHDSLVRFGILALGKKESIQYTPYAERFEEMAGNVRLFRRLA